MSEATLGPWKIERHDDRRGDRIAYLSIRGPNNEAICDLFPHACKGGVGDEAALANARLICAARGEQR